LANWPDRALACFGSAAVEWRTLEALATREPGCRSRNAESIARSYPHSAAFAMGKFALRGLAQSTARELGPKGIHVAHFVIDGGVRSARRPDPADRLDSTLDPDAIARTYIEILSQPCTA
jgi:NAD(P)-dependent dehydrogenase (short-subunit alcohol dehydrogenase family)